MVGLGLRTGADFLAEVTRSVWRCFVSKPFQDRFISGRHLEIMQLFGPNPQKLLVVERFWRLGDGHLKKVEFEAWVNGDDFRFSFQNTTYPKLFLNLSNDCCRKLAGSTPP